MIYLDTSVALAHLLAEDRTPPDGLWREPLVASRLFEYEIWNRIHARGLSRSHGEEARAIIGRVALIELAPPVLARALEPFPTPLRTLDALHIASLEFLRERGLAIELATYDDRMLAAARSLRIPLLGGYSFSKADQHHRPSAGPRIERSRSRLRPRPIALRRGAAG